jgi:geranylgeranyl diphosphate synthase, type I
MGKMQKLRDEIEAQWNRQLEAHPFWTEWAHTAPGSAAVVQETLRTPGKRLRPMLFCLACRAFGHEPLPGRMPAALALELAHNFILVHDDVMDRSDRRRGAPTLPARMAALLSGSSSGGFRGADLALVTGDLLYTMAMESLLRTEAPAGQVVAAMQAFMQAAMDTGRGALLEVRAAQTPLADLAPADIETIYALKTGRYSFALPMQLAGIFSGGGPSFPFAEFGEHAGVAYQLKNDRQGLVGWLQGGPVPDDLRDGRHIWAVVHAWQATDPRARHGFEAPPGRELQALFHAAGTIAAMEDAIERHARAAMDGLFDAELRGFVAEALKVKPAKGGA